MQRFIQRPVLYCYTGGNTARLLENLSEKEVINNVMATLQTAFGRSIPKPIHCTLTQWGKDTFSFGSYSYVSIGTTANDFITLSESIDNRLFFAGEATNAHIYDATIHGAYLSGIREAEKIRLWCEKYR